MPYLTKVLTIVFFLFVAYRSGFGWRRRRRTCNLVNCQVSQWTAYSACSQPCGNQGTQSRTRYKTISESCGGSCPYQLSQTQICNRQVCQPNIGFIQTVYASSEVTGNLKLNILRSTNTTVTSVITVTIIPQTATPGLDYNATTPRTIAFLPGETNKIYEIGIVDDNITENSETLLVNLTTLDSSVVFTTPNTTVLITDNDGPVDQPLSDPSYIRFSKANYSVTESDGVAGFLITRSGDTARTSKVNVTVKPQTATPSSDYIVVSSVGITFTPGETSKMYNLTIIDDDKVENTEILLVQLSTSDNNVNLTQAVVIVNIIDNDKVTFSFSSTRYSLREDIGYVTVNITKTGHTDVSLEVLLSTEDMTALHPSDYTSITGETIVFLPNEYSKMVNLTITRDTRVEDNEDLKVVLSSNNPSQVSFGKKEANITIENDDKATFSLSSASYSLREGIGYVTVNITKTGHTDVSLEVLLSTKDVTAHKSADYSSKNKEIMTFLPNENFKLVNVTINIDNIVEVDEIFEVKLSTNNPSQVLLGVKVASITIENDDTATFSFSSSSYSILEDAGYVSVTVTKSGEANVSLEILLSTEHMNASHPLDYTAKSNETITFLPNEYSKTINLTITRDTRVEDNEDLKVVLYSNNPSQVSFGTKEASITIENDDKATFSLSSASYSLREDIGYVTVNITKNGNTDVSLEVILSTEDVTALHPSDYSSQNVTIVFLPNEYSKTINLTITSDAVVEDDEDFKIVLSSNNPSKVSFRTSEANITIENDDKATFSLSSASYSLREDIGYVIVNITKTGNTDVSLQVQFSTHDVTTQLSSDYSPKNEEVITFLPNENFKLINITIHQDKTVEEDEILSVELSTKDPLQILLGTKEANITIENDDAATFSFSRSSYLVREDVGYVVVNVTKTEDTDVSLEVQFSTNDITAHQSTDYTSKTMETITFLANETSKPVTLSINRDSTVEDDEVYKALLSSNNPAQVLLGTKEANITIENDDTATFSFSNSSYTVREDVGFVTITIIKTGDTDVLLEVLLSTQETSAIQQTDYIAKTDETIAFLPNEFSRTINLTVANDSVVENKEVYKAVLSSNNPTQVLLGKKEANITIEDDDTAMFSFSNSSYSVREDQGYVMVLVTKVGETDIPLSVLVTTRDSSALQASDYTGKVNESVTFARNESSRMINFTLEVDDVVEHSDVFRAYLSTENPSVLLGRKEASINIINDDAVTIEFQVPHKRVVGAGEKISVTLVITSGNHGIPIPINITVDQGGSLPKYLSFYESLAFPVGTKTISSSVNVSSDIDLRKNVTLTMTLVSPDTSYILIGSSKTITFKINKAKGKKNKQQQDQLFTDFQFDQLTIMLSAASGLTVLFLLTAITFSCLVTKSFATAAKVPALQSVKRS